MSQSQRVSVIDVKKNALYCMKRYYSVFANFAYKSYKCAMMQ